MSGDDRTTPILGYTDSGSFDPNHMPANMKAWLENYAMQIEALDALGITGEGFNAPRPTRNSISPLISTHWDQGAPYWNHCPEFMDITEDGDTVGELAYTGCVATSMAQIMNYYKFPLTISQMIPSYQVTFYYHEEYGIFDTESLDPIYFDWDNMKDNYTGAETEAEKDAVAWLMLYAGCAAHMQYGTNASSTSDPYIPTALNEYFNYDAKLVYRSDYEQADWEDLIYQELFEGRPIIYNGRSGTGGGHSFVCDGYAYGDFFHINWGWGGLGDGYFVLSILNPYAGGGVATVSSSEGYNIDQTAIIGIVPGYSGQPEEVDHRLTVYNMYYTGARTFERSDNGAFKLTKNRYIKVTAEDHIDDGFKYLRGIAMYDSNDNFVQLIAQTYYGQSTLSITDCWPPQQSSVTYPFGEGITSGTYKIVPVCSTPGSGVWTPMIEGDRYYLGQDGILKIGLFSAEGATYFADEDGIIQTGWQTIGDSTYFFNEETGAMQVGWIEVDGRMYFLDGNGKLTSINAFNDKVDISDADIQNTITESESEPETTMNAPAVDPVPIPDKLTDAADNIQNAGSNAGSDAAAVATPGQGTEIRSNNPSAGGKTDGSRMDTSGLEVGDNTNAVTMEDAQDPSDGSDRVVFEGADMGSD